MNKDNTILLSYSRSGNSWTRYILELLTNSRTQDKADRSGFRGPKLDKPLVKPFIYKAHVINDISYYNINFKKIILILRNYKENAGRDGKSKDKKIKSLIKTYINNIKYFENFDGEKLILYYEDLIINYNLILNKICDFFDIDKSCISDIMDNIDIYIKDSMKDYNKSMSDGKLINFHRKKLLKRHSDIIDSYIHDNYNGKLLDRYK